MTQYMILSLTALSVVLSACQQAKTSSRPTTPAASQAPSAPGAVGLAPSPTPLPLPPPGADPRLSQGEPRDNVPVIVAGPGPIRIGEGEPRDTGRVPPPAPPAPSVTPGGTTPPPTGSPTPVLTPTDTPVTTRTPPPAAPQPVPVDNPPAQVPANNPPGPAPVAPPAPVATVPPGNVIENPPAPPSRPVDFSVPPPTPPPVKVAEAAPGPIAAVTPAQGPVATVTPTGSLPPQKKGLVARPIQNAPLPPQRPATGLIAEAKPEPVLPKFEPQDGMCQIRPATETKTIVNTPKLDVWLFFDTSKSIRVGGNDDVEKGEIVKFASEIGSFVQSLPKNTDINIGVSTGNGPESKVFASLYNGVIKAKGMSDKQIAAELRKKVLSLPEDRAPGAKFLSASQGEATLLNLYTALSDGERRAAMQRAGFLRKDAHLAIIIVSDEQDICYTYPENVDAYHEVNAEAFAQGRVPVLKPDTKRGGRLGADVKEVEARERFCKMKDGHYLNAQDVATVLNGWDGRTQGKVIMNSITYLSNAGLSPIVKNQDENEMGHGIVDLVDIMGTGKKGDLAQVRRGTGVSFTEVLGQIGQTTSIQMKYNTVWDCYGNVHPGAIDQSSVRVVVRDAKQEDLEKWDGKTKLDENGSELASYGFQGRDGGLKIESRTNKQGAFLRLKPENESAFNKIMTDKKVDGAKYVITFKTKRDIDPETGKAPTAKAPTKAPVKAAAGPDPKSAKADAAKPAAKPAAKVDAKAPAAAAKPTAKSTKVTEKTAPKKK